MEKRRKSIEVGESVERPLDVDRTDFITDILLVSLSIDDPLRLMPGGARHGRRSSNDQRGPHEGGLRLLERDPHESRDLRTGNGLDEAKTHQNGIGVLLDRHTKYWSKRCVTAEDSGV